MQLDPPAGGSAAQQPEPDQDDIARDEIELLAEAMIASRSWTDRPPASALDELLGLPPR